jgi:hypothetical protein
MHELLRRLGARFRPTPAPTEDIEHAPFAWEIEESGATEFEPRRIDDRAWRLWLGLALAAALVVLGLAGRLAGDKPAGPLTTISSPGEGGSVSGGIVHVRGTTVGVEADGIELAVVAGDAVLGDLVLHPVDSRAWTAELPIFAPPVGTEAMLFATPAQPGGTPFASARALRRSALVRRQLWIAPAGPIGLWPPRVQRSGGSTRVLVTGCAPLTLGRLDVRLVTHDGRTLASAPATVVFDASRPGALGGYALGMGSFAALLPIGSPASEGAHHVDVDWRDQFDGTSGTSTVALPGI